MSVWLLAMAGLLSAAVGSNAVAAGFVDGHYVYSDEFGNLVLQRPGGYKQIVVGQGHLAPQGDLPPPGLTSFEPLIIYRVDDGDRAVSRPHRRFDKHPGRYHRRLHTSGKWQRNSAIDRRGHFRRAKIHRHKSYGTVGSRFSQNPGPAFSGGPIRHHRFDRNRGPRAGHHGLLGRKITGGGQIRRHRR